MTELPHTDPLTQEEPPPILGSWGNLYTLELLVLCVMVVLCALLGSLVR